MTEGDIEKLSELAKVRIPKELTLGFVSDFESILNYIKQIESVEIGEIKESFAQKNIFREDINPNETSSNTEVLLKSAPETYDGFVKVDKIL